MIGGGLDVDAQLGRTARALLSSNAPAPERAEILAQAVVDAIPGTECLVVEGADEQHSEVDVLAGVGTRAGELKGRRVPVLNGPVQRVLKERLPLEVTGSNRAKGLFGPLDRVPGTCRIQPPPGQDERRELVPGLLIVTRSSAQSFTYGERELITELGRLLPLVTRRHGRGASSEDVAPGDLRSGINVAGDIATSLDSLEVVKRLLSRAMDAASCDRGTILRLKGGEAVVEHSQDRLGEAAPIGDARPLDSMPLAGLAVGRRKAAVAGPQELEAFEPRPHWTRPDVRNAAAVPLLVNGEVIAILALSRREERTFSDPELGTLQLIGNIAALALHNADLYGDAQAASRAKSQLLNSAAHELRTPITAIAAALSLLNDGAFGEPNEEWKAPIELAAAKVGELSDLVEDLLMAARLEAGRVTASRQLVDLREVVADAVLRAEARARVLRADFVTRLPKRPIHVEADPQLTGRVVDVLLSNAFNYGGNRPRIRVAVHDRGGPRVVVEDHGRGVPEPLRERIFEAFFRHEQPELGLRPGTGLGLYLGRELAHRMGGTLTLAQTAPGQGSTFLLSFPTPP